MQSGFWQRLILLTTNLGCSLCQESFAFLIHSPKIHFVDILRTIKIYHIYIGQKIRLLDWLLVLYGATRRLFLIEATCAPEKPIRHKGRTFPQGQLEHPVLAQFSQVDRQDMKLKQVSQSVTILILWNRVLLLPFPVPHTTFCCHYHSFSQLFDVCLNNLSRISVEGSSLKTSFCRELLCQTSSS